MAASAGDGQRPAVRAAPGDRAHVLAVVLRQPLEIERDVGPLAGRDQGRAGDLDRVAGILLVAGQHDRRCRRSSAFRPPSSRAARRPSPPSRPCRRPSPGRCRDCPCRSQRWNGSPARTPCRDGRSAACACRGRCPCGGRRCGRRGRRAFMSIHSTLKPSGSSSARSISPTASTPGEFSDPLFWLTHFSSMRDRALLLGIDGSDHRLLGRSTARRRRGGGQRWRARRQSERMVGHGRC